METPTPETGPSTPALGSANAKNQQLFDKVHREIARESGQPTVLSARNYVLRILSPLIAVAATSDADKICQVNNIPSVLELLKPFACQIEGKGMLLYMQRDTVAYHQLNSLSK